MAFTVNETVESRTGTRVDGRRYYIVQHDGVGSDSEYDARVALIAGVPSSIGTGAWVQQLIDVAVNEIVSLTPTTYTGTAEYSQLVSQISGSNLKRPAPTPKGSVAFNFNAQAQGGHIKKSLETVLAKQQDGTSWTGTQANDALDNSINVTPDFKRALGVDLNPPDANMEYVWEIPATLMNTSFRIGILDLVGNTNIGTFRLMGHTFAEGELFLSYLRGSKRTGGDYELNIGIAYKKNQAAFTLGGITVAVKGHEYAWAHGQKGHNDTDNVLKMTTRTVFVERVWPKINWNTTPLAAISNLLPV